MSLSGTLKTARPPASASSTGRARAQSSAGGSASSPPRWALGRCAQLPPQSPRPRRGGAATRPPTLLSGLPAPRCSQSASAARDASRRKPKPLRWRRSGKHARCAPSAPRAMEGSMRTPPEAKSPVDSRTRDARKRWRKAAAPVSRPPARSRGLPRPWARRPAAMDRTVRSRDVAVAPAPAPSPRPASLGLPSSRGSAAGCAARMNPTM
mmetsp:Transcript_9108/g.26444  ORF Transcript_9108/g.26444 Transcript_9108/m.26444 type:complete len:209 (+) Transcript_9108:280-906(+)